MRVLAWPGLRYVQQPYITQLYTHLSELGAEITNFTPLATVKKPFDVWHMHWPENRLIDPNPVWAGVQTARLLTEMHAARVRGTKIIWTAHNLKQHEGRHPRLEPHFWRHFVRLLDGWIALSPEGRQLAQTSFPALRSKPSFVIPHGHYKDSYPSSLDRQEARKLLGLSEKTRVVAFVGQIRAYKNVPQLIHTFRELAGDFSLIVAGRVKDAEIKQALYKAAEDDPRVKLSPYFIPDNELQKYLKAADVVALPYQDVLNSGSALLALSFGVPVLVPAKGAMGDLQRYAGREWVRTFQGDLTAETLSDGLEWAAEPRAAPQLDGLRWDVIAQQTLSAYEAVCTRVPAGKKVLRPALAPVRPERPSAGTLPSLRRRLFPASALPTQKDRSLSKH